MSFGKRIKEVTKRITSRTRSPSPPSNDTNQKQEHPGANEQLANESPVTAVSSRDVVDEGKLLISRKGSPGESSITGPQSSRKHLDTAFEGMKITLRFVRDSSDAFPPLKTTASLLIGLIDIVEDTRNNKEDCAGLDQKLKTIVSVLDACKNQQFDPASVKRIENMTDAINLELTKINDMNTRGILSRVANSSKDREAVVAIYRSLSSLFDMFLVETSLATEASLRSVEATVKMTQKSIDNHIRRDLLRSLEPVERSEYDAEAPVPRRSCTPDTRKEILAELMSWATNMEDKKIYWMNGMAGTGKTTISVTLCRMLEQLGMLGASFFCSRADADCSNVDRITPTIAFQLAARYETFREVLSQTLEETLGRPGKNLEIRFKNLLVQPAKENAADLTSFPTVVVIDALDECENLEQVGRLLGIIWAHAATLPIKFFVTSRPELDFHRRIYQADSISSKFHLHDVEKSFVERDIKLYLAERLSEVAVKRNISVTEGSRWPSDAKINALARQAGTLFIYAATVCEYVDGKGSPESRLQDIISTTVDVRHWEELQTRSIDILYSIVLKRVYEGCNVREKEVLSKTLQAVVNVRTPLSVQSLAMLIDVEHRTMLAMMAELHSVVHVPSNDVNAPVSVFHASFPDYLSNAKRSNDFYLDIQQANSILARQCFGVMKSQLRRNPCKVEGQPDNSHISEATVHSSIPKALEYASAHWISHVISVKPGNLDKSLWHQLEAHFNDRVLPWVECLSLIGRLLDAVHLLRLLQKWIPTEEYSTLQSFVLDSRRFILQNAEILSKNSLETYYSALVFLPKKSNLKQEEAKDSRLPKALLEIPSEWDACEMVISGHSEGVTSVAFSPDGRYLCSGSFDNSVRLWDAATGECEHVLNGHLDSVNSVSFSGDGLHIASGSSDSFVKLWHIVTGECEFNLNGHSKKVNTVSYSPSGTYLASGSDDETVRIWNPLTGDCKYVLEITDGFRSPFVSLSFSPDESHLSTSCNDVQLWDVAAGNLERVLPGPSGHRGNGTFASFSPNGKYIGSGSRDGKFRFSDSSTGELQLEMPSKTSKSLASINSIAFSPDSKSLAAGASDNMVHVCNLETRQVQGQLRGHNDVVCSVAFSPDGKTIASASEDKTIRLWYVIKGEATSEGTGHSGAIMALSISPDGTTVASGSFDRTIRLWNVTNNACDRVLSGHSDSISSLCFSPNSPLLASGASDETMRLWDINNGQCKPILTGHSRDVPCVSFSPDGGQIASGGGADATIRVWNATTGCCDKILSGHSDYINSLAYSANGTLICSGSDDTTVKTWNVETGNCERTLFGHSPAPVLHVSYLSDEHVASSSSDKTIRVWEASSGDCIKVLKSASEKCALPNGGIVRYLPDKHYHVPKISYQCNESATVFVLSEDADWILSRGRDESVKCWIPPLYRQWVEFSFIDNKVIFASYSENRVILLVMPDAL